MLRRSNATVFCWAMGLTQHRNAVATIKEVVNLALAQGNIGKRGAGLMPVRGHSNVQGDRTMGIWERAPQHFLDSIESEFGFDPPRENGWDTVDSIRAMRDGKARFFLGLGGNFVQSAPDTAVTAEALSGTSMTVHISTKINRSHLVCGDTALILPTLGRTEKDVQASGEQFISVEDTACAVHASRGPLEPASTHLRSEVAILTGIARQPWVTGTGSTGRRCATTMRISAPTSPGSSPVVKGTRSTCDGQEDSSSRTRPATAGRSRPIRDEENSRSRRSRSCMCPRGTCCCRHCAVTTSSTPRSTG